MRAMTPLPMALLLCLASIACNDPSGPRRVRSTIAFDIRALTGESAALGDGISVVNHAELVVFLGDAPVFQEEQSLAPTDSVATFELELDPGTYDFAGFVFSNSGVLLYSGGRTEAIRDDGFLVEIVPQADTAVMVVSPRDWTVALQQQRRMITIRNAGSADLSWALVCARLAGGSCNPNAATIPSTGRLLPGASIVVDACPVSTGDWEFEFDSTVGRVTITADIVANSPICG
jgi:hypothetical protein